MITFFFLPPVAPGLGLAHGPALHQEDAPSLDRARDLSRPTTKGPGKLSVQQCLYY